MLNDLELRGPRREGEHSFAWLDKSTIEVENITVVISRPKKPLVIS